MHEYDEEVARRVLEPYRPDCRYLKTCALEIEGEPCDGGKVTGRGEFGIDESWYMAGRCHFNSVEFNLCCNQLAYYMLAKAAKDSLIWPFSLWSIGGYWQRQPASIAITDFSGSFRRDIDATSFFGELSIVKIEKRRNFVLLQATSRFWDVGGGKSTGQLRLTMVDLLPSG